MISINVRANAIRRTVNAPITDTPKKVFDELGCDVSTSMINLEGATLGRADVDKTFEELGVKEGTSVYLNAIVKADGASK